MCIKYCTVLQVTRLLGSGAAYFSWSAAGPPLDLTLSAQQVCAAIISTAPLLPAGRRQPRQQTAVLLELPAAGPLHQVPPAVVCSDCVALVRAGLGDWVSRLLLGSLEIKTVYAGPVPVRAALISRLSCHRAGTR